MSFTGKILIDLKINLKPDISARRGVPATLAKANGQKRDISLTADPAGDSLKGQEPMGRHRLRKGKKTKTSPPNSTYLSVATVSSKLSMLGETVAIIAVRQLPPRESRRS